MSVRLNKVVRDLNVGIDTVVNFLQKKGIEIDSNPNAKINDEQYEMLVKEFAPDKILKKSLLQNSRILRNLSVSST